ncbi:kinase-like domain-containing protein [Gigaspora margarita]|uniref:Kinase-like domain-containing protein n=1 Tax=Gigaspora margarita TaxID=4874 RepID=A0A8H4A896_GIGMA|nr:kinase-like domain-containing protein [Gigaspora margarita]
MDMISDCRQRAIVILRMFPELEGPKYFKALCNIVINDPLLEIHEKTYLIYDLSKIHDTQNIINKIKIRRRCEYCNTQVIAILYCERCIRNYLEKQFRKWTGDDKIDELIQKCQRNTVSPSHIIEWIPYENFENINFETSSYNSIIHSASWKNGPYTEWDNEQQELKRDGKGTYILKHLGDTEKCYNEIEASFTTEQLFSQSQVRCYGLTRSPHTQNFVLVLHKMDSDLRRFLKANNDLSWKIKFKMSTKWNILKGANSEKRFDTEVIIMKKMEDLLRDAYINNGIIRELNVHPNDSAIRKILNVLEKFNFIKEIFSKSKRIFTKELSRTSKEIKPSISENTSTLLLLEEDGRISKDITSIPEQDKRISTIGLNSLLSISEHDGGTTTINAPIMEQEESNATDVCPLPSKQKENSIVDDALILRQNECDINLQIKRNSANLTGYIYILRKN